MCGIIGYIGDKAALPFLIEGLKKLEYRGYDSAGIALLERGRLFTCKQKGKIAELESNLVNKKLIAHAGIGHTRWATHGRPSNSNSHPHLDCKKNIAVVHNGIIENYLELRRKLYELGHRFSSTTDTEVIVHLIEKHFNGNLEEAVRLMLKDIKGSFAIAVMSRLDPHKIVVARRSSPLVVGLGEDESFIASDIPALLKYTGKIIYLSDNEMAVVKPDSVAVSDFQGRPVKKKINLISWDPESAEKGGYAHFMLKEIHEQPRAVRHTIHGRIKESSHKIHFDELKISREQLKKIKRVVFTACGTSWHAALVGEYLFEQFIKIPTEVEYAAEFRYREPVIDRETLVIAISQSGETADTLAAVCEAKALGGKVISICNVVGSSLARESDGVIYTYAGPEIGVASTKAFTTQLTIIYLLTIYLAQIKGKISSRLAKKYIKYLLEIPGKIESILTREDEIEKMSGKYCQSNNALYLGRGKGFPIALEGALKLKEVSYIHAEGYPAAEMKHGPIALIDKNMPVVILAFKGRRYEKIMGNIEEVKARGGKVLAVATEGDTLAVNKADSIIYIPETTEYLSPILAVIPLQLFAYFIAVKRGCHVDQPRNLAKSVTVE